MRSSPTRNRDICHDRYIRSPAWLLCGISSVPGELKLTGALISFTAHGTGTAWDWQLKKLERRSGVSELFSMLSNGGHVVVFSEPVTGIRVRSPWYYFSGGLVLKIRQQTYSLSFGQPAGSLGSDDEVRAISVMRHVGRQWLRLLRPE